MGRTELEQVIEQAVQGCGYGVFDLEAVGLENPGQGGVLRVFLSRKDGSTTGIGLDDCARVSRALAELPRLDELIPGHYVLEVSTAGVNRRLKRPEHFANAIGERVRLVVLSDAYSAAGGSAAGKKTVVKGTVRACRESTLELADEALGKPISLALDDIVEARVDFDFGKAQAGRS